VPKNAVRKLHSQCGNFRGDRQRRIIPLDSAQVFHGGNGQPDPARFRQHRDLQKSIITTSPALRVRSNSAAEVSRRASPSASQSTAWVSSNALTIQAPRVARRPRPEASSCTRSATWWPAHLGFRLLLKNDRSQLFEVDARFWRLVAFPQMRGRRTRCGTTRHHIVKALFLPLAILLVLSLPQIVHARDMDPGG